MERDLERWRKAFFEFIRLNSTRDSSAQRLLELYAGLTDKKAEPSAKYESELIWFHVTTNPGRLPSAVMKDAVGVGPGWIGYSEEVPGRSLLISHFSSGE